MGDRDAAPDPGRPEILAALQHLEEHPLVLLAELQEGDQLAQDVVLGRGLKFELDGVFGEEFAEFHPANLTAHRMGVKS
ncbi:hypothetical protein D3C83_65300 [compost metagenome]